MDKVIKKLLIDRDMSITDLARITGYGRTHLSAVIHGRLDSRRAKRAIALALGVEFSSLWPESDGTDQSRSPRGVA